MIKNDEILYFEKVVDLYNVLDIPIEQNSQFSINNLLNIHKEIPYKSPAFRTNYYSFVFIKNGEGNYTTDEQKFEYQSNTIYFTNPRHIKAFEFYQLTQKTYSEKLCKRDC